MHVHLRHSWTTKKLTIGLNFEHIALSLFDDTWLDTSSIGVRGSNHISVGSLRQQNKVSIPRGDSGTGDWQLS